MLNLPIAANYFRTNGLYLWAPGKERLSFKLNSKLHTYPKAPNL